MILTHGFVPSPLSSDKMSPLPLVMTTVETDAPLLCAQNTCINITVTRQLGRHVKLIHIQS